MTNTTHLWPRLHGRDLSSPSSVVIKRKIRPRQAHPASTRAATQILPPKHGLRPSHTFYASPSPNESPRPWKPFCPHTVCPSISRVSDYRVRLFLHLVPVAVFSTQFLQVKGQPFPILQRREEEARDGCDNVPTTLIQGRNTVVALQETLCLFALVFPGTNPHNLRHCVGKTEVFDSGCIQNYHSRND